MKKFFFALIIFYAAIFPVNCQASDVWIYTSEDEVKNYIMTETIKEDYNDLMFAVCVKAVLPDSSRYITEFYFVYRNGHWYSNWAFNGMMNPAGWELAINNLIPPKAFNACKSYVRLAREYPLQ